MLRLRPDCAPAIGSLLGMVIGLGIALVGTMRLPLTASAATSDTPPATTAPAAAPATTAAKKATPVGSDTCQGCHEEAIHADLQRDFHGAVLTAQEKKGKGHLCEGCHGPGSLHAEDPSAATAAPLKASAKTGAGCVACHSASISPAAWQRSPHHRSGTECQTCHGQSEKPHGPITRAPATDACLKCHGTQRGEFALPSHHPIKEKGVTCADCHDVHAPMDARKLQRDVCVKCHVKQRGPHRFEHGAITGHLTEACLDCHRPHGSPNRRLLKMKSRGLCLQCHADLVTHFPGGRCWDCHQGVHGSNTSRLLLAE